METMRNVKRILQLCSIAMLALFIYSSCLNKSDDTSLDKSYGKSDSIETYHTIVSDDSLVTAIWYDTGEGGTAPDIDCVVNSNQKMASSMKSIVLCCVSPTQRTTTATMRYERL